MFAERWKSLQAWSDPVPRSLWAGVVAVLLSTAPCHVRAQEPVDAVDEDAGEEWTRVADPAELLLDEQHRARVRANAGWPGMAPANIYAAVDAESQRLHPVQLSNYRRPERGDGIATVLVNVDEQGRHAGAELARGSGSPELDRAAVEATYQWTYTPASSNGVPLRGRVRIVVSGETL